MTGSSTTTASGGRGESVSAIAYMHEVEDDNGVRVVIARAYGNQIDVQRSDDDDQDRSWFELIAATLPAIEADIDQFGIQT